MYELSGKRVWVAGHKGMVGSALVHRLSRENCEILVVDRSTVDLRRQEDVERWMSAARPHAIFLAAAKVGGILANSSAPADFLYDNLAIETSVIHAAYRNRVEKLLFLGSSCIYPKFARQPIGEGELLEGALEPTNEWYAIAKIAGLKLALAYRRQHEVDFISAMPTNLYGPGDNFDSQTSHVLPALIRKTHEAKLDGRKTITLWGSGNVRREFLHVTDCADALVFLMKNYSGDSHVNVGTGEDLTVNALAAQIAEIVGFKGDFDHDLTKPDGTPRKLLDISRLKSLGWSPAISLREGVAATYDWYMRSFRQQV